MRGAVDGIGEMIHSGAFAGYFDILPHALRDDDLRGRILALYRWWYGENRKWLGMTADARRTRRGARLQLGVAQIVAAIIDGLSIQDALEPEGYDVYPALDALAALLEGALPVLTEAGAAAAGRRPTREPELTTRKGGAVENSRTEVPREGGDHET